MSTDDINLILYRLVQMEQMLKDIHTEVKRTNGRVTALELDQARNDGDRRGKAINHMVAASVISGGLLAVIIWFVSQAI